MSPILWLVAIIAFLWLIGKSSNAEETRRQVPTYIPRRRYEGPKSYEDSRGYLRFKDSDILVHRYLASKKIGRRLRWHEVVHHVDGNKRNNSATNLEVYNSWADHDDVHRQNQRTYGQWHKPISPREW